MVSVRTRHGRLYISRRKAIENHGTVGRQVPSLKIGESDVQVLVEEELVGIRVAKDLVDLSFDIKTCERVGVGVLLIFDI